MKFSFTSLLLILPLLLTCDKKENDVYDCTTDDLGYLYKRYIEPLMVDDHPQSCNQCHLSGVDLRMVSRETPCQAMACMIELGWVDLKHPEASKILDFILMAKPESELITQEVVQREHDGFLEWIVWASDCQRATCGKSEKLCAEGSNSAPLPIDLFTPLGGCDEDDLVTSFGDLIYRWHGRCQGCHWIEGKGRHDFPTAPLFMAWTGKQHESARLTMYNVIGLGTISPDDPLSSTLITKPLKDGYAVQTDHGNITGTEHGGGPKFKPDSTGVFNDDAFNDFLSWTLHYSDCYNQ